jgi:hypothetical protein
MSSTLSRMALTNSPPRPDRLLSYHSAASASSAAAAGWKRKALAPTETSTKLREDFVTRNWLDSSVVDVGNAALNLFLPVVTKVTPVQAGGERLDEVSALSLIKLQSSFENVSGLHHFVFIAQRRTDVCANEQRSGAGTEICCGVQ